MRRMKLIIIAVIVLCLCPLVFCAPDAGAEMERLRSIVDNHDWEDVIVDPSSDVRIKGFTLVNDINLIMYRLMNPPELRMSDATGDNDNIYDSEKVAPGYLRINKTKHLYFDYSELYANKINYLVYVDTELKLSMLYKAPYYLYFIDASEKKHRYFKLKLNSFFFTVDDFAGRGYSLKGLIDVINENLYTLSIIDKEYVTRLYEDSDRIWRRYFFYPDNKRLMFKPGVAFSLKHEVVNLITHKAYPSKVLPLWQQYTRHFTYPEQSPDYLNELICIPNFYNVWLERHKSWLPAEKQVTLSPECREMITATRLVRARLLEGYPDKDVNLVKSTLNPGDTNSIVSKADILRIISLNRMLLEETFPRLCPKRLELGFVPEHYVGDSDESMDGQTAKQLYRLNVDNKILIEKNDVIEQIQYKSYDDRYYMLKDIFTHTDLILVSTQCTNGTNTYDQDKYLTFDDSGMYKKAFRASGGNTYGKHYVMKTTLPLRQYYNSLHTFFTTGTRDDLLDLIYDKEFHALSRIANYCRGTVMVRNKEFDFNDYQTMTYEVLRTKYEYIGTQLKEQKLDLSVEDWIIPFALLKVDDDYYTSYFINVSEDQE